MKTLFVIVLCMLPMVLVLAQEKDEGRDAIIDRLIEQLGSQTWREREQAQKKLEEIGEPALEKLMDATKSDDPERSSRAEKIVKKIEKAITERRINLLARKIMESLRPGEKISEVEREIYRQIAESVIDLRSSESAPVVKPRTALEKESGGRGVNRAKIGGAWTSDNMVAPSRQLYKYRQYQEALNLAIILGASQEGLTPLQKARLLYQLGKSEKPSVPRKLLEFAMSEDAVLRLTAIMQLQQYPREEFKPYFLKWLEDSQPAAREYAALALSEMKLSGDLPGALEKALKDKDYRVRRAAAAAVASVKNEKVPGLLIPLMEDKIQSVRAAAAAGLGCGPADKVRETLLKALKDDSDQVVASAVMAIGRLKDKQALENVSSLLDSKSPFVKMAAVETVVIAGLEKYQDKLAELGNDNQSMWYVIRAIEQSKNPQALNVLEKMLSKLGDDSQADYQRIRILTAMLSFNKEKAREKALKLFNDDKKQNNLKYQLIRIFKECPDAAVVQALIAQLDSKNASTQTQSLEALRYMTARELDTIGSRRFVGGEKQRKKLKEEWEAWWKENKEGFSFKKAALARLEKINSLVSKAREQLSQGKYSEAQSSAIAARRLEPGKKETEEIVRKASFLQSIEREMKTRGNRK